jgi:hypothetical protein
MIIYEKDFDGVYELTARAGTTGLKGGDAGHGCKTIIEIDFGGFNTELFVEKSYAPIVNSSLKIKALGDSEAKVIIAALEWIAATLRKQIGR